MNIKSTDMKNSAENFVALQRPAASTRRKEAVFESPVRTSVEELLALRTLAMALSQQRKKRVRQTLSGPTASKILGRGLDFSEVRSYQPGDDVRMIDWKVTARTGDAHTKLFVEERERPVFLVIDLRSSMHFATRGMFKSVMACRLAAMLGWCAVASNDRVGGLVFTDNWHAEIKPQSGRRGLLSIFRNIELAQSKVAQHAQQERDRDMEYSPADVAANLHDAQSGRLVTSLMRLRRLAHGGSLVTLFTDFDGFDKQCEGPLSALRQHAELSVAHLSDPLERDLPPPGSYSIVQRAKRFSINSSDQNKRDVYASEFETKTSELKRILGSGRSQYFPISTDTDLSSQLELMLARAGSR